MHNMFPSSHQKPREMKGFDQGYSEEMKIVFWQCLCARVKLCPDLAGLLANVVLGCRMVVYIAWPGTGFLIGMLARDGVDEALLNVPAEADRLWSFCGFCGADCASGAAWLDCESEWARWR